MNNNNNNSNQLLDKLKQQQTSGGGGDDLLSSLVFNAQNDAKRIYKAKNEILPVYKFKRWFKPSKKQLQSITNSVIYTNGSDKLTEDVSSSKMTPHYYSVPWLGVDKKNLEYSETVMIDIDSDSTTLPVFCKILIVHQGAVHVRSPALLLRDVSIQVGNDDILFNNNSNTNDQQQQQQQLQTKNKRSSWALADEYYSTPFYQHSGKTTGSKYNQDTQVTENEFLSYSSQETSTDDLISHLRLHIHSKTDIMSEFSLSKLNNNNNDNTTENTNRISSNNIKSEKRFRRLSTNNEKQNNVNFKINQNNIKRYENVCSLTGIRRLTLIMPPTSNFVDFDNNIVREIDYLKPLLKFEEYNVVDSSMDTSDLNKYIQSDNYTYIQLLSENALIGKGVQKINNNINNNNTENLITTNAGGKKSAISSSSSSSILKSATQLTQPKKKLVTINHNKSIQQTKSNNIATQTDLFKKINETKEKHQQHFPIINNDHNYDITDILERYNLKKLATDSSLVNNSNETHLLAPSLTPFIPHTKIPISPSSSNNNKEDLSIDLTQINLTDQSNQHLSSSRSFNQSNRSHRSSSSHNNNNNKELINDTNDFYYCYYNANNSRYPLISRAVSNNHHQQQRYDENNEVVNEKLRSKSSKPVLMRGRSFRIIPTRNDLHHSTTTTTTAAAVLDQQQQQSKHRTSRKHEEKINRFVSNETNEENKYCSNCNRKQQENRKEERLPTTAATREKEIILKLDKTKVNDIEFVENSPKIDRIVFIPAVLASRSEHANYYHNHNHNQNNNNNNHNHIDTNITGTNNSRYRRSKF